MDLVKCEKCNKDFKSSDALLKHLKGKNKCNTSESSVIDKTVKKTKKVNNEQIDTVKKNKKTVKIEEPIEENKVEEEEEEEKDPVILLEKRNTQITELKEVIRGKNKIIFELLLKNEFLMSIFERMDIS